MQPIFVLVHSPSVGPSTWHPVAEHLTAAGCRSAHAVPRGRHQRRTCLTGAAWATASVAVVPLAFLLAAGLRRLPGSGA
jgi:hypothetical protein